MRFVLAASGSRGEGDPLIALGIQLQSRGHEVVFIATEDHQSQAHAFGIKFHKVDGNLRASLEGPENRGVWARDRDAVKKWNQTFFLPVYRRMLDAIWEEAQRADVLILNSGLIPAQRAGQILNIPTFISCCFPALSPTRYFPHLMVPRLKLGPLFNRLSYSFNRLYPVGEYGVIAAWYRETLRVRPPRRYENYLKSSGRRLPILYCYSEELFCSPPDWDDSVCASGYWSLPEDPTWKPSPVLLDFLQSGPPPVCVSFSSMIGPHPERSTELVAEAIRRLPNRALVCGGWGGLREANLPNNALFIQGAPFQWLFNYVALVVHHGGAGTTAAAIRAGKPAVICPVGGDHPFWAAVAHQKGVAPPFRMHHQLTVDWLVDTIRIASSTPSMARSAKELGRKLRQEDSFGKAIRFIEGKVETWRRQRSTNQARRSEAEPRNALPAWLPHWLMISQLGW
jgi:sterol 3beta-glucosyltransferase